MGNNGSLGYFGRVKMQAYPECSQIHASKVFPSRVLVKLVTILASRVIALYSQSEMLKHYDSTCLVT